MQLEGTQTVPLGWLASPQVLLLQVANLQGCPDGGQLAATLHSTHWPLLLHTEPPFWLHMVPGETGGLDGTPLVQTSPVHCWPSTGTSVFSMAGCTEPMPSQTSVRQLPDCCCCGGSGVLEAVKLNPHALLMQVRCLQKSSVPGQSVATTQPTQVPMPSHKPFVPQT